MIAVWLVGTALLGDQGVHDLGVEPGGVGGARSSATSTHGVAGSDTPGSGSPTRWATTRRSMSRRSVARSAISPPMLVKTADELLDRGVHGLDDRRAAGQVLLRAERRPLSRARPALAVSTSAAAPFAFAALSANRLATVAAAAS